MMMKKIILILLVLSVIFIIKANAEMKSIGKYKYDNSDKRNEITVSTVLDSVADIESDGRYDYELKEISQYDIVDNTVKLIINEYGCVFILSEDNSKLLIYAETRDERFFKITCNKK